MKEALGKPREWESFNLEKRLTDKVTNLAEVFPVFCRPHKHVVRGLAAAGVLIVRGPLSGTEAVDEDCEVGKECRKEVLCVRGP